MTIAKTIEIFDPALCCSTGVCGVNVDQQLVSFAADVEWLKQRGGTVTRFNLAHQPLAFAERVEVSAILLDQGQDALPITLVDGNVALTGRYATRTQLVEWAGIAATPSLVTTQVAELVAVGAAIASNCEPCFVHHIARARALGVSDEDVLRAVELAQTVKDTPARALLAQARARLGAEHRAPKQRTASLPMASLPAAGCCEPADDERDGSCC